MTLSSKCRSSTDLELGGWTQPRVGARNADHGAMVCNPYGIFGADVALLGKFGSVLN